MANNLRTVINTECCALQLYLAKYWAIKIETALYFSDKNEEYLKSMRDPVSICI